MGKEATAVRRIMAKQAATGTATAEPNMFARLKLFFQDVQVEMSKVAWPSKEELKGLTQVVLVTLLVLAAIVGLYDWVFLNVVKLLLLLG